MFSENLKTVREQFAGAMDLEAGRNLKVSNIFEALENLEQGKFKNLKEMHEYAGFKSQNKVFQAVSKLLENMGTPPGSVVKAKRNKLDGTAFALDILAKNGVSLPQKKVKEETVSL
jgi:hypothetical protein